MLHLPFSYLLLQSARLDLNQGSETCSILHKKDLAYVQPTRKLDLRDCHSQRKTTFQDPEIKTKFIINNRRTLVKIPTAQLQSLNIQGKVDS